MLQRKNQNYLEMSKKNLEMQRYWVGQKSPVISLSRIQSAHA